MTAFYPSHVEYQFGKNEGSAWKHIRIIGYYDLGMPGYVREEDLEDCTYRSGYRVLWRTNYANEFCEAELTSDTALSGMDGERIGFLFAGVRLLVVGETENDYFVLIRNSATAGLVPKGSVVISQNRYTMNAELNMINDASVNNKDGEACIYPTCEIETGEWNCYPLSAGDRIAIIYHVSGGWSFVGHLSSIGIVKYTGFIEDRYIVSPEQQSTTFLSSMDENMNTRFLSETEDHASDKIRYVSPSVPTHRVLLRPAENSSEYIAKLNAGTPVYIISEGSK